MMRTHGRRLNGFKPRSLRELEIGVDKHLHRAREGAARPAATERGGAQHAAFTCEYGHDLIRLAPVLRT